MRALFGLDALPRGMQLDDPRLPSVTLDRTPLRLNTQPVPQAVLAEAGTGHQARVDALTAWLLSLAGPWAAARRRLITTYMASIVEALARNRVDMEPRLARYVGLYTPQDYFWSALRPLPRAWIIEPDARPLFVDVAFWDGETIRPWPEPPHEFWRDETLPSSPFRRPSEWHVTAATDKG